MTPDPGLCRTPQCSAEVPGGRGDKGWRDEDPGQEGARPTWPRWSQMLRDIESGQAWTLRGNPVPARLASLATPARDWVYTPRFHSSLPSFLPIRGSQEAGLRVRVDPSGTSSPEPRHFLWRSSC